MHGAGKDAAHHNPEQRHRAEQAAGNGTHHGTETGDVQQLNQENLPHRQGHEVHAIGLAHAGHGHLHVHTIHLLGKAAIPQIPCHQQQNADEISNESQHIYIKSVGG